VSRPATNPLTTQPEAKPWSGNDVYHATLERKSTQSAYYRGNGHWLSHYPRLVAEWHPTKNGPTRPEEVSYGAAKLIWWKCPHGPDHEWRTRPSARTVQNHGCPFCSHKALSLTNSLAAVAPEVAAQWHPKRNKGLTPSQVIAGSGKRAWWQCPVHADHLWQAQVCKRVYEGSGCPACEGLRVSVTNSLARTHRTLAKQWHPTKNGEVSARDVVAGSARVVWWKCPRGDDHEWQTEVRFRANHGNGCPMCARRKPATETRLSAQCPELVKQWHPTKNPGIDAADFVLGSKRRVWWLCEQGHSWQAAIFARVEGVGCPECSTRKLNASTSLAASRPDLALQWHPTKNGARTPEEVHRGSPLRVWWKCPEGPDHEWQAHIHGRATGNGTCPFCAGRSLSVTNSLAAVRPDRHNVGRRNGLQRISYWPD
jgi:hypothetical protein